MLQGCAGEGTHDVMLLTGAQTHLDELIDSRRWLQRLPCTVRSHATSTMSEVAAGRRQSAGLRARSSCPQTTLHQVVPIMTIKPSLARLR